MNGPLAKSIHSREPNPLYFNGYSNETITGPPIASNPISEVLGNFTGSVGQVDATEKEQPVLDEVITMKNGVEPVSKQPGGEGDGDARASDSESCSGRYIYIHDLPSRFNDDLLKNCQSLLKWKNMCQYISNMGLGPQLANTGKVLLGNSWFATNQFLLGVIFHNRMKQYECLTNDSALASAIYVPFYAGLEVGRNLWGVNTTVRDSASLDLVEWLAEKPEWNTMWGRDHFLVSGRIAWDFRRVSDRESDWGNKLMFLPQSKNMTMLAIESSCWNNDFAIPYPTYFHPSSDNEVYQWQNTLRRQKRRYLFSFVGAPRPNLQDSIRGEIIEQCGAARRKCKLLDCNPSTNQCHNPVNVMKMFQNSVFCLEPPGDSYTRRSTFDSILAGCIPVFFHPRSAYLQYAWHLPKNNTTYSVLIPEKDVKDRKANIKKILLRISKEEILTMREEVIKLIPRVIYANPRARLEALEDAFDIAVKGILERIESNRRDILEGRTSSLNFAEKSSWK
ncbi:hypothetical protein L1049_017259 [Liquidambar formosana]|uniref:Exostosin GT47 domain-containing protein n=1 Tax=Liquidambar formosana TaxID=63359 RepID=A0AAP0S2T2_LIQFO